MFVKLRSKYGNLDDGVLLDRYLNSGDLEILGALYHRYMHLVYGLSLKYLKSSEDSKDAVMQIFEKLVTDVRKQEINNFKSWLYVVAKNHCLMALRRKKNTPRHREIGDTVMEIAFDLHPNGEEKKMDLDRLNQALLNLPEHQKRCIELFYYQSKSYAEVARETGYDLKKVKSYIQNGKRNLKGYLDKK